MSEAPGGGFKLNRRQLPQGSGSSGSDKALVAYERSDAADQDRRKIIANSGRMCAWISGIPVIAVGFKGAKPLESPPESL